MKKQQGSVRDIGQASVGIDIQTRDRLKIIAGDKPVSQFLRDWSSEFLSQNPLPGAAGLAGPVSATKGDISIVKAEITKMGKALIAVAGVSLGALEVPDEFWTGEKTFTFDELFDLANKARQKKAVDKASQSELKLI